MSKIETGGPAFPCETFREEGMSLRDYFAAKAMQAIIGAPQTDFDNHKLRSEFAYGQADAMLAARDEGPAHDDARWTPDPNKTDMRATDISCRTRNILMAENCYYMEDAQAMTDEELLKIANLGSKSLKEIRAWVNPKGAASE